jgi:hypothetical protein
MQNSETKQSVLVKISQLLYIPLSIIHKSQQLTIPSTLIGIGIANDSGMADGRTKRKAAAAMDDENGDSTSKRTKPTRTDPRTPLRRSQRLQKQLFRFMELPQELQDMVYHHLWLDTPTVVITSPSLRVIIQAALQDDVQQEPQDQVRLRYDPAPAAAGREVFGFPRWLLANKAILDKGLKQLRDNMTVSWSDTRTKKGGFKTRHKPSSLIDVLAATNLRFLFYAIPGSTSKIMRTRASAGLSVQALTHELGPKMKSLEFHMLFTLDEDTLDISNASPVPWLVVFPPSSSNVITRSLPLAETLKVRLALAGHSDVGALGKQVQLGLKREAIRLAERLVGRGAKSELKLIVDDGAEEDEEHVLEYKFWGA